MRSALIKLNSTPPQIAVSLGQGSSLLRQIQVQYGPVGLLGRFFLKADQAARDRGIDLSFASLEELAEVNRQNAESWQPLLPIFEPQRGFGPESRAFCVFGRDQDGNVVATQAGRVFDFHQSSLFDEATSMRLFYPAQDLNQKTGKTCTITAPAARQIRGRVTYSGGGWYHPAYRGLNLSTILPRISRAYAFTRWNSQTTVSFINTKLLEKGVVARYGYSNAEPGVRLTGMVTGDFHACLAWMHTTELLADLERFVLETDTKVDVGGQRRRG